VSWPSPPGTVITEGPLSAALSTKLQDLAAAAARADGVAPLSEDILLQVKHGSATRARDLAATTADGTLAGYAHLDPPDEAQGGDASGETRPFDAELALCPAISPTSSPHQDAIWHTLDLQ